MTDTAHQAAALAGIGAAARTPWITVSGGKGGVGKTLIAVNLSLLAARAGYRTLLVDLDPGLGNIDVHLRLAPMFSIEDLADGTCLAHDAVTAGPGGISVLTGRSGSTRLASGDAGFRGKVFRAVEQTARAFDLVIADTGAGIGPSVVDAARRASVTLAVTTPDPAAVTDTYALTKLLVQLGNTPPRLLVNGVRNREDALRTSTRLTTVCRKFLGQEMPLCGWLHRDRAVERSVAEQRPLCFDGTGRPVDDLRAIAAATLSELPARRRRAATVDKQAALRRLAVR